MITSRALIAALLCFQIPSQPPPQPVNILVITADDLGWDSVGCYGNPTKGVTPHIDNLASEGIRFERGHATTSTCMPSRAAWVTGRYPHRNGVVRFTPINDGVPVLPAILKDAGYYTGIIGKVSHLKPVDRFKWDVRVPNSRLVRGRSPEKFYAETKAFLQAARDAKKPFFLMANSHDPHRPFAGSEGLARHKYPPLTRRFKTDEVRIPGFLPDLPRVRVEITEYHASVHRLDVTVGKILDALDEAGLRESTLVLFMSDHGASLPFAKANCYLASTKVPIVMRWPDRVQPGRVDADHYVSGIDIMPTLLEASASPAPEGMDGESFMPLLEGNNQDGRDSMVTVFHHSSGDFPMRCFHHDGFGYIYNAWSDGTNEMTTESLDGHTFVAMQKAAAEDRDIARRIEDYQLRTPEELFDFDKDPNALTNLVGDDEHAARRDDLRARLLAFMREKADPLLPQFEAFLAQK